MIKVICREQWKKLPCEHLFPCHNPWPCFNWEATRGKHGSLLPQWQASEVQFLRPTPSHVVPTHLYKSYSCCPADPLPLGFFQLAEIHVASTGTNCKDQWRYEVIIQKTALAPSVLLSRQVAFRGWFQHFCIQTAPHWGAN